MRGARFSLVQDEAAVGLEPSPEMGAVELLEVFLDLPREHRGRYFMTVREAADWAEMNPRTIRRWLEDGSVKGFKKGGQCIVLRQSLRLRLCEDAPLDPGSC